MFDFLKQEGKRILLINFEGLSVYVMDSDKLVHIAKFSDEDSGHDGFRDYLSSSANSPVTILVDSVAEEFIVEKAAHVGPLDRKSFLRRKLDQHFRGAEYRSAKILGREENGRRDDNILFSSITKNQTIEPWVKILLEEEVSIKSVTSPPYALCKIVAEFNLLTSESILLVNWEESGIRQSLIAGDKMTFSRLTPLPNDQNADLARAIVESCNQSKDYLERVGLVSFEEKLDVHVITPQLDEADFEGSAINRDFRKIYHHNSIDLMRIDKFSGAQRTITAVLLCLDWGVRRGEYKNIYAPSAAMRFHQLQQARKWIGVLSLSMLLLGGLVAAPMLFNALERSGRISQLQQNTGPVQLQYDSLTAQFPETPIPSEAMELAVRNFDLIQSQAQSPSVLFEAISQVVLAQPSIVLSNLEWSLRPAGEDISFTDAVLQNSSVINVDMYGSLIGSSSIQGSDRALRQFIDLLGSIEGVTVSPISLPIESRPDSAVSAVLDDGVFDSPFALNIQLET